MDRHMFPGTLAEDSSKLHSPPGSVAAVASGACRIFFAAMTAFCRHGPATPAAACPTPRIAITTHMPKQSRSSLILPGSAMGGTSNSSSRFTTQARAIARATTSGPATDLRVFYTSDEQKRIAEDTIADVDASGLWPGKAVTEVVPAGDFWEAEPERQDYLERYPDGYTCHFVRPHWRLPIRTDKVVQGGKR